MLSEYFMDTDEINRLAVLALKKWIDDNLSYWGGQKNAAKTLGISSAHLSYILSETRPMSEKLRLKILKRIGVSYEHLILELMKKTPTKGNIIDLDHAAVIQKFKNKALAREINEKLVEVENIDPDALTRVVGYIEGLLSSLAEKNKTAKREDVDAKSRHGDMRKRKG